MTHLILKTLFVLAVITLITGCESIETKHSDIDTLSAKESSCKEFCAPNKYSLQATYANHLCICGGPQNG